MYGFWYDYVKPKYGEKAKLCSLDRDSFIVHVKTDDGYKAIAKDVEARFYTLKLSKWKNKKSNFTNEIWIRWENRSICSIKCKNL